MIRLSAPVGATSDGRFRAFFSKKPFLGAATARAGNVIGGGDWGEDRLIPDLVRGLMEKKSVNIRSPDAIRPWQFVLDALYGYMLLAEKLFVHGQQYSGAWNFGPSTRQNMKVIELVKLIRKELNVKPGCPYDLAYSTGALSIVSDGTGGTINPKSCFRNMFI